MGSFRPGAGNQHLHWYFNFTGCIVETALKSLRLSCGSGLTRQGISLWGNYSYGRRLRASIQSLLLTSPLNLPAPGRRQPIYLTFRFLHRPVFLLNSCLTYSLRPHFCGTASPSYRVILPGFLNNASSVGLGILSSSTCVRFWYGYNKTIAAFLDAWLSPSLLSFSSHHAFGLPCGFLQDSYRLHAAPFRAYALHTCPHSSVLLPIQESQPVVHRLRLSSSP